MHSRDKYDHISTIPTQARTISILNGFGRGGSQSCQSPSLTSPLQTHWKKIWDSLPPSPLLLRAVTERRQGASQHDHSVHWLCLMKARKEHITQCFFREPASLQWLQSIKTLGKGPTGGEKDEGELSVLSLPATLPSPFPPPTKTSGTLEVRRQTGLHRKTSTAPSISQLGPSIDLFIYHACTREVKLPTSAASTTHHRSASQKSRRLEEAMGWDPVQPLQDG